MSIKCIKDVTEYNYSIFEIKGVVDWFSSRLDCVYGVQSNMCSCFVKKEKKQHYFSPILPLFYISLSLLR